MKFSVSSADLLKALTAVNGAVPSKSTLPILECVLFERDADADALRLSATDLEVSIVQQLPVQFGQNGTAGGATERVAVPAKRLLDTLRQLPDLPVTFSSDETYQVELTTDQGRYKMVGFDGADYPALPSLDGLREIAADGPTLRRAIAKTAFAVSKDALRPAMMGVYFQVRPEHARVVATDGHRLVKLVLDALASEPAVDFIVPEKALALTARAAGNAGEGCTLHVGNGYVAFDFGGARVMGRLIDEQYPNYEAVIPVENERRLVVGRDALLAAVRRVALYSSSMTHQIRLKLEPNRLTISAEDIERASEARETVLCEYAAEPMEIGFNSVYLTEVLQNVDGEDVVMEFSSPNRAGVVTPADEPEGEEMMMLIMPVMLNTYA
jgi:DNA polymerase III subunit beta